MEMAASQLEDNVVLGTMMLALGEVDGLVSGAVHSTANTIRPALQIIKTKKNARAVSSIFFICLPEQVLIYGDCAVIPDPDAETLADLTPDALRQALVLGVFGLSLTVLFFTFQAPDVALSEIVISTVGLPLIILLALRKIREQEHDRKREEGEE